MGLGIQNSIVIPVRNEEKVIVETVQQLIHTFDASSLKKYEIILVNDNSNDRTRQIIENLELQYSSVRCIHRDPPAGFGRAIRDGIHIAQGQAICIVMGDASDEPKDVVTLLRKVEEGYDVVYGNRFITGSKVVQYPIIKLIINRMANYALSLLFRVHNTDLTNAFKAYNRDVFKMIGPLTSNDFDITIEIPLKAQKVGFTKTTVPVKWYGRKSNISKFSLISMCRPYIRTSWGLFFN